MATDNDDIAEDASAVTVSVAAGSGYAVAVGSGSAATVVNDDDAVAPPLTATLHGMAAEHDGATPFTFELRFSETFPLSYRRLQDHAFTVTDGRVTQARRVAKPSNLGWEVTVAPTSDEAVAIVLPATVDCNVAGAICTEDGRPLSRAVSATVPGPLTPRRLVGTANDDTLEGFPIVMEQFWLLRNPAAGFPQRS